MVNPYLALDSIVSKMKLISGFVTAMGSSANISAYKDAFPDTGTVANAIHHAPCPSALVYYRGFTPKNMSGMRETWGHEYVIALKPGPGGLGEAVAALFNGVPTGQSQTFNYCVLYAGLAPMGSASGQRMPLVIDPNSGAYIEYFEIAFTLADSH
jgi:hypothetical protein